uniref:Uncharacterized protein n=1 Tax=Oryza sativa subsp. japonica TaxID=39947 RepID=Q6Z6U7_ORYSJ|nr:hypothetical protein [Oryza sativa Japonica Group]BAD28863.1 hypothetical protein [Oryza sativa Japonica Group]
MHGDERHKSQNLTVGNDVEGGGGACKRKREASRLRPAGSGACAERGWEGEGGSMAVGVRGTSGVDLETGFDGGAMEGRRRRHARWRGVGIDGSRVTRDGGAAGFDGGGGDEDFTRRRWRGGAGEERNRVWGIGDARVGRRRVSARERERGEKSEREREAGGCGVISGVRGCEKGRRGRRGATGAVGFDDFYPLDLMNDE